MNDKLVSMTVKLTIICAVAALVLGFVNIITEPTIIENKRVAMEKALESLSDGDEIGDPLEVSDDTGMHKQLLESLIAHGIVKKGKTIEVSKFIQKIYPLSDNGDIRKYILQLIGNGYGGKMVLLAVFDTDGSFVKAKLMENNETVGIGKKAENPEYFNIFSDFGSEDTPVPVNSRALRAEDVEVVTSSTITFVGIAKAIALGSDYVKLLGGEN